MKSPQHTQQPLFYDQIPAYMHEYIKEVINVDRDGNCGYRAVAMCLGRNEDKWSEIKKELLNELNEKEQFYRIMPQIGNVIANTYQRPLYFFSLQISLIFLPYHYPLNRNEALAMAFINENHYVALVLRPGTPVPLIVNR
ncbi:12786_t:CDS:2 [Dentiscutata heterogama]|uniref:12786_t:CDS:1 n=1 Tax=Dentiscutata heterogama TaxID=1316150 RepID=A0ACA9NXL2_9GLOM|nr:12786_t:CDS:2 [Dentiscutata heterogama]